MTKVEAIEKAKKGIRITHQYFHDEEWFYIDKDGLYVLDDDIELTANEFWFCRANSIFNDGYSEYVTNTKTK